MKKVDELISSLSSPAIKKRRNAIKQIGKIGDSIFIEHLILAFGGDDSWSIRAEAAKALGMCDDDRLIEPLIAGTQDESEFVRAQSIISLIRYNENDKAITAVVGLLQDEDEDVVGLAVCALYLMKKIEESIEPLLFLYINENMKPSNRIVAGWILAEFTDERIEIYAARFKSHKRRYMRKSAKELLQRYCFKNSD